MFCSVTGVVPFSLKSPETQVNMRRKRRINSESRSQGVREGLKTHERLDKFGVSGAWQFPFVS